MKKLVKALIPFAVVASAGVVLVGCEDKPAAKPAAKPAEKAVEKAADKATEKAAEAIPEKK